MEAAAANRAEKQRQQLDTSLSEIFALFADLAASKDDKGEPVLSKEELVEAHGGDFHLFAKLDVDQSGFVDANEFTTFLTAQAAEKEAKHAGKHAGHHWLQALLDTLSHGHKRAVGRRAQDPDTQMQNAVEIFGKVAALSSDDTIAEADLITAQGGNFHLFHKISGEDGTAISLEQWKAYISTSRTEHESKHEGGGGKWLHNFVDTLVYGYERSMAEQEDHARQDRELRAEAEACYVRLADLRQDDAASFVGGNAAATVTKDVLIKAQGGDLAVFTGLAFNAEGVLLKEEWVRWNLATKDAAEAGEKGVGYHQVYSLLATLQHGVEQALKCHRNHPD